MEAVALQIVEWAFRSVYGNLMEVRATEATELRIKIREQTALEQRILREIDTGNDVARAECDLLRFSEEIVDVTVEHEFANHIERNHLFGNDFRCVQYVELELVGEILIEDLQPQFIFWKVATGNGVPQIAAVKVGVGAVDL